jgi:hypothetical protein
MRFLCIPQLEYLQNVIEIPEWQIGLSDGAEVVNETADRVVAISNHFVEEINSNSARMVAEHAAKWPYAKLHSQRHTLVSVPLFKVRYTRAGNDGVFWVCGTNKLIYSDDYPAQCCFCCICHQKDGCCAKTRQISQLLCAGQSTKSKRRFIGGCVSGILCLVILILQFTDVM